MLDMLGAKRRLQHVLDAQLANRKMELVAPPVVSPDIPAPGTIRPGAIMQVHEDIMRMHTMARHGPNEYLGHYKGDCSVDIADRPDRREIEVRMCHKPTGRYYRHAFPRDEYLLRHDGSLERLLEYMHGRLMDSVREEEHKKHMEILGADSAEDSFSLSYMNGSAGGGGGGGVAIINMDIADKKKAAKHDRIKEGSGSIRERLQQDTDEWLQPLKA
jgi:hypothetical protein